MSGKATAVVLGALTAALAAGGCERAKAPVNGLAGYELGKTTLASVEAQGDSRCFEKDGFVRCLVMRRRQVAGHTAQIELDFAGKTPQSVLAEIMLEIPGCRPDDLKSWFVERIGKATEDGEKNTVWSRKHIYLSLKVVGPARCQVVAVHPVDEERIERLKTQG